MHSCSVSCGVSFLENMLGKSMAGEQQNPGFYSRPAVQNQLVGLQLVVVDRTKNQSPRSVGRLVCLRAICSLALQRCPSECNPSTHPLVMSFVGLIAACRNQSYSRVLNVEDERNNSKCRNTLAHDRPRVMVFTRMRITSDSTTVQTLAMVGPSPAERKTKALSSVLRDE